MKLAQLCFVPLGLLAILAGCSGGSDKEAVAKMANTPDSGHVRVFNAGPGSVKVKFGSINHGVAESGLANDFHPVGVGRIGLQLDINGTPKNVSVPVESGLGTTVCVSSAGELTFVEREPRHTKGDQNARVVFLNERLEPVKEGATSTLAGPLGDVKFSSDKVKMSIPAGDWKGVLGETTVDPAYFYSVYFIKSAKGWQAYFLVNTKRDKPVQTGNQ
ncbi:MAG: hypothetical protein ABL949_17095 [Fimbriimonadaceae bacterium]